MADHRRNALAYVIELFRRSRLAQRWAPVLIWMAGIFYFSSRRDPLGFLSSSAHGINVERLAHIGEYAGLAALLHPALAHHEKRSGGTEEQRRATQRKRAHNPKLTHAPQHLCTSALIALAYALFDELHQELAPERGFELADIGYDLVGIIAALGLIWARERRKGTQRSSLSHKEEGTAESFMPSTDRHDRCPGIGLSANHEARQKRCARKLALPMGIRV